MSLESTDDSSVELRKPSRFGDRQIWFVLLVAAVVLLPRGWMITQAQSERSDDEYHIRRGVQFLIDGFANTVNPKFNDPPLGEVLTVLPLWAAGCWPVDALGVGSALWNEKYSADTILNVIGIWKSLLLLPMIVVAFIWVRNLYGLKAAWVAVGLLLVDPTIAAHTPLPTLDVLGMETIVIACFLAWRYFEKPTGKRLVAACVATAVALLVKHTAVPLPLAVLVFAAMWWIRDRQGDWGRRIGTVGVAVGITLLSMWVLLSFDYTKPNVIVDRPSQFRVEHPFLQSLMDSKLPGGLYITSFFQGMRHADAGHTSYFFGEIQHEGRWQYFPVLATYKIPIGMGLVMLLGLASLFWKPVRWEEWGLFIPLIIWTVFMLASNINIGWRHFLPAYALMLMAAVRFVPNEMRGWAIGAWAAIALAALDASRYHPDYLCYITWPRKDAWRDISDSNVDWGQGLKAIREWAEKHPLKRRIYVHSYNWRPRMEHVRQRLGPNIYIGNPDEPRLPTRGVVIVSPVSLVGAYEKDDPFKVLREKYKPIAIIGHALFVYDLDAVRQRKAFDWINGGPSTQPTTQPEEAD